MTIPTPSSPWRRDSGDGSPSRTVAASSALAPNVITVSATSPGLRAGGFSPYLLPNGNVQIAFSGGRTSAYMLHQILEANGGLPDRARVIFTNTGREKMATLDFVQEVGSRWGVPIVWLEYRPTMPLFEVVGPNSASRHGEPFEALINRKRALPNQAQRWCTEELKVKTARRYLVSLEWRKWTKMIGFRADEPARLSPKPQPRETLSMPLAVANVTKHDVAAFWAVQPFDLRLPIIKEKTVGGNCLKCFLKSEADVAAEIRDEPEDDWPDRMEAKTGRTFSKRYSHVEMRTFLQRQGDAFDTLVKVGALCQANDGECTG